MKTDWSKGLDHLRALRALGQRAIDYYVDTGECVFCSADDCTDTPHEDGCNVGKLSGVVVSAERKSEKARQRNIVHSLITLSQNDLYKE